MNEFPKNSIHKRRVVLTNLDEKRRRNEEKPDFSFVILILLEVSRGVLSGGASSSSGLEVASDTSMPFGSFALLSRAILSRILRASVVLPFTFKYLGDSGARLYKRSTANEGIEDSASSHFQFNVIITICTRSNKLTM